MKHRVALALGLALTAAPGLAQAFCGFYVGGGEQKLVSDATMVVLMRDGQRTVLSMQNNYKGPPSDFAMVVPVPVVLQKENVKTLPRQVFDHVDQVASPRLVEYWEQDPCGPAAKAGATPVSSAAPAATASAAAAAPRYGVKVEAEFTVAEYEVVILSASDAGGLDRWLRDNHYRIPEGAEPVLRPYVAKGMKFFVAKVNARKVAFEGGQAVLSPLRFHYDSEEFSLPVRLGLLNSAGTQELVVHVLARGKRYEVANYPNVTIPTNYDVTEAVHDQFGPFYAALFDKTLERRPGAVVTEYAWDAMSCDPCPGPTLGEAELVTLGADALAGHPPPDLATDPYLRAVVTATDVKSEDVTADARSRVERELPFFERCYTNALPHTRNPRGKVSISIEREPPFPSTVAFKATGSLTGPITDCVEQVARTLRLSGLGADPRESVSFTLDFDLRPAPGGGGWWRPVPYPHGFTLTRLHTRYAREGLGADLIFREAPPIVGGREEEGVKEQDHGARLSQGSSLGPGNAFQARYIIRHPWKGPIRCAEPRRGIWGGPPDGREEKPRAAEKIAYVPRGKVDLPALLAQGIPEVGVMTRSACGCGVAGERGGAAAGLLAMIGAAALRARRRRRTR
jgi:MYXO-CTERM domain-containing protein